MADLYYHGNSQTFIEAVIDGVRRIIERWVITKTILLSDATSGDNTISVESTRRFNKGDQFLIMNSAQDVENELYVLNIIDQNRISVGDQNGNIKSLKWNWPVANEATIVKTLNNQLVKAVYFGEPDIMQDLPAITVDVTSRNSEFLTLRSTKERYNVEIGVFVSGTSQEEGDRFLKRTSDLIQYGLKRNFYPLLNDYTTYQITADILAGDRYIKVSDTSPFAPGRQIIIEDKYNIDVNAITTICDSTTLYLASPMDFNFYQNDTTIILPNRLPFNSWPTDVTFGKIKKGTLLKAAVITYFIEELQDHRDAGFGDTQLS